MQYIRTDKIYHHPDRLLAYRNEQEVLPVTVEIHLTNRCNLNCYYCSFSDRDKKLEMSGSNAQAAVSEIAKLGVRGITFSGGGEPTVHKDHLRIMLHAKNMGMDVGLITNGVNLDPRVMSYLTWIRFSVDSSNPFIYKKIRGVGCLNKVKDNIKKAVKYRKDFNLDTTIGLQAVVTKDNISILDSTAEMAEKLGVDYFQYRPIEKGNKMDKPELTGEYDLKVIDSWYKWEEIERVDRYTDCPGADFIGAVGADMHFYMCCHHVGDRTASYGHILKDDILANRRKVQDSFDYSKCPIACRGSVINQRLSQYNKIEHVNFL